MTRRKLLVSAEILAWSLGLLCTATFVANRAGVAAAQKSAAALHGDSHTAPLALRASAATLASTTLAPHSSAAPDRILGRLEIPALHLTTPIVDDDDAQSLRVGAGHIRGTAMPGGLGNFAVAAHRDTFFRPLSGIRPGMKILVITSDETFTYVVDATKIVIPEQVDVLDMGHVPQMTLITCYPFHYIGAAPRRFTVQAHLLGF